MRKLPETIIFGLSAALLALAPLLYSGKTAFAEMLLGFIGLGLLSCILWFSTPYVRLYRPIKWFIILGLCFTALYLLPLPQTQWEILPGREFYLQGVTWLQQQNSHPLLTASLVPTETRIAFLALIAPLGVFLAASYLSEQKIKQLALIFLGIAALEASIGLIQYASNNPTFFFGLTPNGQSAQGTYRNRDHFAALMEMALPLSIALTLFFLGRPSHHHEKNDRHHWLTLNRVLIFASLTLLILLGGIFSRSRAGVFLSIVAVLLSSLVFSRHVGGKQSVGITAILGTIAGGFAVSIGLIPILNRFAAQDPLEDARWEIFRNTMEGIKTFFPLGSGPGTFPDVYRSLQPIEQMGFVNNAHNDYLELLFEMGVIGIAIITAFLLLYVYGWIKLWGKSWNELHFIQNAAGIGIFIILLHSFSDFNLHTPANMIAFTFLCGLFFRKPDGTSTNSG